MDLIAIKIKAYISRCLYEMPFNCPWHPCKYFALNTQSGTKTRYFNHQEVRWTSPPLLVWETPGLITRYNRDESVMLKLRKLGSVALFICLVANFVLNSISCAFGVLNWFSFTHVAIALDFILHAVLLLLTCIRQHYIRCWNVSLKELMFLYLNCIILLYMYIMTYYLSLMKVAKLLDKD